MKNLSFLIVSTVVLLASCQKEFETKPGDQFEFLGPLLKTNISMQSMAEANLPSFSAKFKPDDLGIPTGTVVTIPALVDMTVQENPTTIMTMFKSIGISSVNYNIEISNSFPVKFEPGAVIKWINSSNNSVVFEQQITEPLPPNGSISVSGTAEDKVLEQVGYFEVTNINTTDSYTGTLSQQNYLSITFQLSEGSASQVVLADQQHFDLYDTIPFQTTLSGDLNLYGTGTMRLFLTNSFPASMGYQLYFLDSKYDVVDSLFESAEVLPASVDGDGNVTASSSNEIDFAVDNETIRKIDEARYVINHLVFDVIEQAPTIQNTSSLDVQLTADLTTDLTH